MEEEHEIYKKKLEDVYKHSDINAKIWKMRDNILGKNTNRQIWHVLMT